GIVTTVAHGIAAKSPYDFSGGSPDEVSLSLDVARQRLYYSDRLCTCVRQLDLSTGATALYAGVQVAPPGAENPVTPMVDGDGGPALQAHLGSVSDLAT